MSFYEYTANDWRMLGPSDDWSNAEVLAEFWPNGSKYPDYIRSTFLLNPQNGEKMSISAMTRSSEKSGEFYARETILDAVQEGLIERA